MPIVVILPAFNEASKIGAVIEALPERVGGLEVIPVVVDDGSSDGTGDIARTLGVEVLTAPTNRGKGHALRMGIERVRSVDPEVLVWMDCDGQHPPELLPDLVAPVLEGSADMVVGSRYLGPRSGIAPFNRRLVRRGTILALRRITGCQLSDPFSGFRSFSPAAVAALSLRGDGYESELEACLAVRRRGLAVIEIAIPMIYGRDTSKMGYRHGRFLGRLVVISCYVRTLVRGARGRAWRLEVGARA
jgi:glycosyltransferase involved in cell wall biosynthesis